MSLAIRTYTWNAYGIYLDIQALQISLLGGRIFFSRLRYHGNNETILLQNGYITWSYWQWRVRDVGIQSEKDEATRKAEGKDPKRSKLPCRVNVVLTGLEWFIYNRSAAYDSILDALTDQTDEPAVTTATKEEGQQDGRAKLRRRPDRAPYGPLDSSASPPHNATSNCGTSADRSSLRDPDHPNLIKNFRSFPSDNDNESKSNESATSDDELPLLLQFYPINLQCNKAAVVMGNENTKSLMVIKTKGLSGEIDATSTETPDPYRELYQIKLERPTVEFRDNPDYKEDQADRAAREKQVAKEAPHVPRRAPFRKYRRKALHRLRNMVPFWNSSVESFPAEERSPTTAAGISRSSTNHWQGLTRYLDDLERNEHLRWAAVEYAAVNTILDTPEATITIYWDTPGLVSPRRPGTVEKKSAADTDRDINGDEPPAWGINLAIKGGTVNYGPWADRHRAELQRVFVPGVCKDAQPAKSLPVGASRVPTQFKLYVELDDDVTLRVPIREESKNWRFRGKEPQTKTTDATQVRRRAKQWQKQTEQVATGGGFERQYGWLDVKIAANSSVSYNMDMVAGPHGFSSSLALDFPRTEISSSINHELLWRSGKQRISCDLSTPLKWNALRQWKFDITTDDLELFILRDHVFLLTDLVNDWSSGPPAEYLTFTPFKYLLDLHFRNLVLYLNVNDGNIINKPTDLEDNAYLILKSPLLDASTCIPLDKYRPPKSVIPFEIRAEEAFLHLHVPPWNTQASFLKSMSIGRLENLLVDGGYHYNAITSPAATDTLVMNVSAQSPTVNLYGFVIRYFLKVKDNYFGDDVHFKTLEEYQEMLKLKETDPEAERQSKPPAKKSNDMDVMLSVKADDPKFFLPANLYSSERTVEIDASCVSADLRFTNYYMDLDLVFSPLHLSLGHGDSGQATPLSASATTQLYIDGISVYGHRVFGLPPTEPTYLCNWDLSIGAVTGECSAGFLTALMSGGKAFGLSLDDDENALIPSSAAVLYDVTFLRCFVQSVKLWLHVDEAAFLFATGSVDVNFNDWARTHYSNRANITIPNIEFSCVNAESISRHRARLHDAVATDLVLQTSVNLAIITRKSDFSIQRRLQQELLQREDTRTTRTPFLLLPGLYLDQAPISVDPVAQSVPPVPQPVHSTDIPDDTASLTSSKSSRRSTRLRRQASFLSVRSSSQSSVIGPGSSRRSSRHSRLPEGLRPLTSTDHHHHHRGGHHRRDVSASTGRRSAFYSAYGDLADGRDQLLHNTVAFSSQYSVPYFPFESVRPDTSETLIPSIESDDDMTAMSESFDLSDIDPKSLREDRTYSSILVEMPQGVSGFSNPMALKNMAALVTSLQPSAPEDVLDAMQIEAMSDIFEKQKKQEIKGTISDLHVRIPHAHFRFINSSELDSAEPPQEEQDQYDVHVNDLAITTRTDTCWEKAFDPTSFSSRSSFHARLGILDLSASERLASRLDTQVAVNAQMENVMVSMGTKDVTYIDGDVGAIKSSVFPEKIDYVASLVHRTTALGEELGKVFSQATSREGLIERYVTYNLVTQGQGAPDATFLVRPSAVLRSAGSHLRTFDSWKLAGRLRQIWSTMHPADRERFRLQVLGTALEIPDDARHKVVEGFQQWRSWDLDDTNQAELMKNVFGKGASEGSTSSGGDTPVLAVLRLRDTRIILNPGPKQNEIRVADVTTRYQDRHLHDPESSANSDDGGAATEDLKTPPLATLNIYCNEATVRLSWDLLELAENLLRLYTRMQSSQNQSTPTAPAEPAPGPAARKAFHVVAAINHGEVSFDAINLNAASLASGLKASVHLRSQSDTLTETDLIVGCEAVTSRLRSHGQVLGVFQLRDPAVLVSHALEVSETTDRHTIKASANSKKLNLEVHQDPIGLLEVLDLLIKDEVAQLYHLKNQLPKSPRPKPRESKKIKDRMSSFRVNTATFLDEYSIRIPLLQSLTYCISGVVARAAMAANFGKEIIFDFDVKENAHDIRMQVNRQARSLSLLQIPPLNGRVIGHFGPRETSVSTYASIELIKLDASAVYSLLSALNRPEISSAINDIQEQVQIIQGHLDETFETDRRQSPQAPRQEVVVQEKPKSPLVYKAHVTFEGLKIFGNSPLKSEAEPLARVLFLLANIDLDVTNRPKGATSITSSPEVRMNLHQIEWSIARATEDDVRICGRVVFGALVTATTNILDDGSEERHFNVTTDGFDVMLSAETISTTVDVLGYMNDKIKDLDTSRELELLRKLKQSKPKITVNDEHEEEETDLLDSFLSSVRYTLEIRRMQIAWLVLGDSEAPSDGKEDLVFAWDKIELGTRTKNSARLAVENFCVQTVPRTQDKWVRSPNSALMPEVVFNVAYVSTANARRMAFQAVGKALDLRLTSGFVIPVSHVADSINLSIKNARQASQHWTPPRRASQVETQRPVEPRKPLLGNKRLESLLLDADFAGAVVYLAAKKDSGDAFQGYRSPRAGGAAKYAQFASDEHSSGTLMKSPGIAFKVEYRDPGKEDPSLYGEIKIDASTNTLYPSFVPLVMDLTSSIKEVVSGSDTNPKVAPEQALAKTKSAQEEYLLDPTAVIGRLKLNLGMRICKQEFTLSCQPIARVAATASFEDVYFTVNTVASADQGNFFAISGAVTNLHASVRHVYSREETGQFQVDSMVLSLMNSKHVSGTSGVSAILKLSPMKVSVNAKQLQDFLLFREIWMPRDARQASTSPVAKLQTENSQGHLVQRYQQVAATAAFPWTATVLMTALEINVDLGQAIGRSRFAIEEFWVSSKKTSDWEQDLCLGFKRIAVESQGRMSGFVALQDFQLRTSIQWPEREQALNETPKVQASVTFRQLQIKAAFDYQAFLVTDITSLDFLMYNVRRSQEGSGDRLVATFEGEAVNIFGTTTSAAQAVALYQAFQKLVAERRASFETSLKEIEKFMKRKSVAASTGVARRPSQPQAHDDEILSKAPISLDTDVVVTLKTLNLGVFPTTFSDHQVFKAEALNAQARFAASLESGRIHSILGLTLGQLRIGLAGVRNTGAPKALSELTVEDVVASATGSRGGTILKVPKVEAIMQTWQAPASRSIDYIFKSAFEGKVEVGWNYSRVSYIRGMFANHNRTLAQAYGKEVVLPSAIKVTGVLPAAEPKKASSQQQQQQEVVVEKEKADDDDDNNDNAQQQQQQQQGKITAEVDLPQSKYEYRPLEPPVIETPQLRDMGEATPPLEWIGLHRDRLPNLTHQIVIVSLLELAGEVEDAYSRILGSS